MNDFTKDELEKISEGLDKLRAKWNASSQTWKSDLQIKIQTMIDSYCEHEWEEFTIRNIRCKKCEKDIWYE